MLEGTKPHQGHQRGKGRKKDFLTRLVESVFGEDLWRLRKKMEKRRGGGAV